jgi:uncharacterized membrane protein
MVTTILLYILISLIAAFTAFTVGEYFNWKDNDYKFAYAGLMFVMWPVMVPLTFVAVALVLLKGKAVEFAAYLKRN